jgi:hypothetical protein
MPTKTPAKKTAAPAKRTPAKSTPAKSTPAKATPAADSGDDAIGQQIMGLIKSGALDFCLEGLDDAVTDRLSRHLKEKAKETAAKKGESKTVPQPTRKSAAGEKVAAVTPEVGKSYLIHEGVKVHGGKKGKFLRYFKGEKSKSVIDIGAEKPIVVPTVALRRSVAAAGRPVKKVAAKSAPAKTVAKKAPAKKTVAKK